MKDYSYDDIKKMQDEAMRRVKEMQRRSQVLADGANEEFGLSEAAVKDIAAPASGLPAVSLPDTRMPVVFPDNKREGGPGPDIPRKTPAPDAVLSESGLEGIFGKLNLNLDTERVLLLAVILLLYGEKCDIELMLALVYIFL